MALFAWLFHLLGMRSETCLEVLIFVITDADVVQLQDISFPSSIRGFDSRHRLLFDQQERCSNCSILGLGVTTMSQPS